MPTRLVPGLLALALTAGACRAQVGQPLDAPGPVAPSTRGPPISAADPAASPAPLDSNWEIEFNAEALSDNVFRGADQSNHHIADSESLDISYKSAYVGASTARVDFTPYGDPSVTRSFDVYTGYKDEIFGFTYDVGLIYYGYAHAASKIDYAEAYIRGSRAIGPLTLGLSLYGSSRYPEEGKGGGYLETEAAYRVTPKLTVSAVVGQGTSDYGYLNWNLGAAYALDKRLSVDLRYIDTDAHDISPVLGSRVVLSLKAHLP